MAGKLGSYLNNLRKLKKKSLRQVEAESGISNAHLSQIEQSTIEKPSLDLLEKLSAYFQVDLDYLKGLAGYSPHSEKKDSTLVPLRYITATQLNTFADSKEAEGILPELVRDLIVSTVNNEYLDMPVGGSVFMHGWDGLLNCSEKPEVQFVPEGFSCWEMSKAKNILKKTENDFEKRTKKPLNQTVENSTYVQVLFRRVGKDEKAKIIADGKNKTAWKDIKVIDAEDLELWLERSPVVALSYAKRLGLFPNSSGLTPLTDFWDKWWASTEPAIDQSLLLEAGKRCDDAKKFVNDLNIDHLKIKSNDFEVGLAFFYATILNLEDQTLAQSLISRSMIVDNEDAFRLLATRFKRLILIPTFKGAPIGEAKLHGHRIVSVINNFNPTELDVVGRVRTSIMAEFLKIEGSYSDEKAYRTAQSCYGNLAVLKLMLADEGEAAYPAWSTPDQGNFLVPFVMLGGWSSFNESDQKIVAKVSGKDYSSAEIFLDTLPLDNSLLFEKLNGSYSFYQEYCYSHLNKYLSEKNLTAFFDAAKEVLCEINPRYDLDSEKRFAADLHKKGSKYSSKLRMGIVTSLAMLTNMSLPAHPNLQSQIDNLVAKILGEESNWKFWASLNDVMMLIAEASPSVFLDKIEKASKKEDFVDIFMQTSTMGGCDYAPVLWALEGCAWDRKHFKQTSRILMGMAEYENKKSNYRNQPSNSLWDIYRVWANQSNMAFGERVAILRDLENEFKNQVWDLLISMIPKGHETGNYTYRPKYRDIEGEVKNKDGQLTYVDVMNVLTDYVLQFLEADPAKWLDVLDLVFSMRPRSYQVTMVEALLRVDLNKISEEIRMQIFREMEKKISHQIQFPNADWAAKGTILEKLKTAYALFSPQDLLTKWSHVFDYYVSHPEIEMDDHDYSKKEVALRKLQIRALRELLDNGNEIETVKVLLQRAPSPWIVGSVFFDAFEKHFVPAILLVKDEPKGLEFISGLIFCGYRKQGFSWLEEILKLDLFLNSNLRGQVFLALPGEKVMLTKLEAEKKDVQDYFWKNARRFFVLENVDDAIYVIKKFLKYERPLDAFYVLANFEQNGKRPLPTDLSMEVLEQVMNADLSKDSGSVDFSLFDYHLENILRELGKRDDADKRKLALVEWNFLPLFKYSKKPENLTEEVTRDPSMFIDILKIAYKKDDRTNDGPQNEAAITRAYQFLHDNKTLPGMNRNGAFDYEHFQNWFLNARSLAAQCSRVNAFDSVFGQFLAYSPTDPDDKGWPHKSVREVFEKYGTEEMEEGLIVGMYNKRGVYTKSLGDGGAQERQLSKTYADDAKVSEVSWPRISKVLRQLSANYLTDAHREDVRSLRE